MDQAAASGLRVSKLPTPSVRVRKGSSSQAQGKENILDGSYLETSSIQANSSMNKRPSLDCDELPVGKRTRFNEETEPTNIGNASVGLKKAIKKRARKSLSKAVQIRNNKVAKAAVVKPTQRPAATQRKPLFSSYNYSKPSTSRFQPHSAKKASVANTPVTAVKPSRSTATSVKSSTKRKPWDLKGQLEDVRAQLASQEEIFRRLEALENEKKQVKVENASLSSEIKNTTGEISNLQALLQRQTTENETKERTIRTLNLDLEESRRMYNKESKDRYELELEVREMRKEKLKLEELKDKNAREIHELKDNVESLENRVQNHLDTIAKQEEELRNFEKDRRTLLNEVQELKGNIRVFCRVRPALGDEERPDHIDYVGQANKSVNISNDQNKECQYTFDQVFGPQSSQEQVFQELSQLVQSALDGFNVCVFAYGQTGSGKTYTMEGPDNPSDEQLGIIPRAMREIFSRCQELEKYGWKYNLAVEHVEIYREKLQDLLSKKNSTDKLEVRTTTKAGENKVWVSNLTSHTVKRYADISSLLELSKRKRATAATLANDRSSRSHSVFMLQIKATNEETGQNTESTLNLVDLAGSERVSETGSSGIRLKEAQKINGSLSSLSSVISALANKDSHIPYRNSKLTFLLMNSLGGNSKTLMLVNINPAKTAVSETINTLRFATTVNNCNIGTAQKIVKF